MEIQVNLKSVGKKEKAVKPVIYEIQGHPSTVRELIFAVTDAGVREYNRSRESSGLLSYLTIEKMDARAQEGKISFGINHGESKADLSKARENALQCFEDGIYRIFLDGEALENPDETICIRKNSVLTFVRLTMLSGRMW
ncbi:MAG: hypothetical protein Q4C91_18990 [Eubacteriales bacterium]|nr:hypothetical protein [Eubacteriales bacterium]